MSRAYVFAIVPHAGRFMIESPNGGGTVLARKPRGPSVLDPVPPRLFATEAAAAKYMAEKGMQPAAPAACALASFDPAGLHSAQQALLSGVHGALDASPCADAPPAKQRTETASAFQARVDAYLKRCGHVEFTTPAGRYRVLNARDRLQRFARDVRLSDGFRAGSPPAIGRDREDWQALKPATDRDTIRLGALSDDALCALEAERKSHAMDIMRKRWRGEDCSASVRLHLARDIEEAQRELVRRGLLDATDHDKVNAAPVQEDMDEAPAVAAPGPQSPEVAILAAVQACLIHARQLYSRLPDLAPDWNRFVRFDLRGRAAGQAIYKRGAYAMRYNLEAYALDPADMVKDTVPHEVAHIVAHALGYGFNHGPRWRAICVALGGNGKRCHNLGLKPSRNMRPHRYVATCGTEIMVTTARHKRLQSGATMRVRATGGRLDASRYFPEGAPVAPPMRAQIPASVAPPAPAPAPRKPALRVVPPAPAAIAADAVEFVEAIETKDRLAIAVFDGDLELLGLFHGFESTLQTIQALRVALLAPSVGAMHGWPPSSETPQEDYDRMTARAANYNVIGRWENGVGLDLRELTLSRLFRRGPRASLGTVLAA